MRRTAAAFDRHGMISRFRPTKARREDHPSPVAACPDAPVHGGPQGGVS
ncbi:MAG TPA: hypothetical protein VKX46_06250 [Ktedonobacteraceae bacterium]|nr:hypothetical protein [Ktedonobacteraceae bacterium]